MIAAHLDCRRRSISNIPIHGAIAVIHGAHKLARASLFSFAFTAAVIGASEVVARLGLLAAVFLEKLLLLPLLIVMGLLPMLLLLRRLLCLLLRLRWGLGSLHLRLLALMAILLARSVLAAPAPAAMPLRWRLRRLTVVRR